MAFGDLLGTLSGTTTSITNPFSTTTGSATVIVGDLIVVLAAERTDNTTTAIIDNLGNVYTPQNAGSDAGNACGRAFYTIVTQAGSLTSVTATTTASANDYALTAAAIRGPFSAIDTNPANITNDTTTPYTCPPTGTLAQAIEVVIAWITETNGRDATASSPNLLAVTAKSAAEGGANSVGGAIGYQVTAATTTISPEFTFAGGTITASVLGTMSFKQRDTTLSTEANWHQPYSEPRRDGVAKAFAVALAAAGAVNSPFTPPTTFTGIGWQQSWTDPLARKQLATANHQSLAFVPVVSTAGSGVGAVPTGFSDAPRIQSFQYQVVAAPVLSPTAETVTLDKWYVSLSEPVRVRLGLGVAQQNPIAFVKAAPFPETTSVDRWLAPLSEPWRRKPVISQDTAFVPVVTTPEVVTVDKWYAAFSQPSRRLGAIGQDTALVPVVSTTPETITVDKWYEPLSEPTRLRGLGVQQQQIPQFIYVSFTGSGVGAVPTGFTDAPRILSFQYQTSAAPAFTPTAETVTLDKWYQPFGTPTRRVNRTSTEVAFVRAPEPVTLDKWFHPFEDPSDSAPVYLDTSYDFVAIEVSVDSWYIPWPQPPVLAKQGLRVDQQTHAAFVPVVGAETVTVDKWFRPLSEPVRSRAFGVQYQAVPQFIYVSLAGSGVGAVPTGWATTPLTQWFQYQNSAAPVFTPAAEIITVDKWFEPLSEPTRRRGIQPQYQAAYAANIAPVTETITLDKWWEPFSEPVRIKAGLATPLQQSLALVKAAPFPETASVDRWLIPLSEPIRTRRLAEASQQFSAAPVFVTTAEVITVDKWFEPYSEPARSRPGLGVANQQSLALVKAAPFPETVSIDRWLLPLSEPVRIKPGLLTDAQREVGYANIQPVVSFGWFNWLVEPVRLKPGLGAPYQLSYAANISPSVETITVDKWFEWLSEPVRVRARLGTGLNQYEAFVKASPFPETVTESRWHQPWSEPVRFRRFPTSEQQALAYVRVPPQAPVFTNWFTALSEPVRFRELARAQYPFFAYYPPPIPSPTIIVRPSDQAEVSIVELEANKAAYVSIVEIIYR